MDLDALAPHCGEWLRGTGPESDIIMSSRIRLARNLADFPFPSKADDTAKSEIVGLIRNHVASLPLSDGLKFLPVSDMNSLDRQFLVERQLISREHSEANGPRGVAVSDEENISLMVNEEDHLRIQVIHSGFALDDCWREINRIDDLLSREVTFAFDDRLGYLTACPTNVGTGIRVSVMLHLPGLVLTKELQKVFQALQRLRLAVRGLYGEGSQAMGDFYQISNQVTLGHSEESLIQTVQEVVPSILKYERKARESAQRQPRGTARSNLASVRHPQQRPDHHIRRDAASAVERPAGHQPRPDRQAGDSDDQRVADHDAAGASAKGSQATTRIGRTQRRSRRTATATAGVTAPRAELSGLAWRNQHDAPASDCSIEPPAGASCWLIESSITPPVDP